MVIVHVIVGILIGIPFALISFYMIRLGWRAGGVISQEMRIASAPVPSPDEISRSLEAEWGRPPTFGEVAAMSQMLSSRRNQALLVSGATLGGIYLLGHHRV